MKLIVGLGNPGEKYRNNRHNVGFMVLDELARRLGVTGYKSSKGGSAEYAWTNLNNERVELFKPMAFMNESGRSVAYVMQKHRDLKTSDIWMIHDDLDIQFGNYKIQKGKGPKEHKGLMSIDEALGTSDYWHIRVGVDNRPLDNRTPGEEYVLQDFGKTEIETRDRIIKKVTDELISLITDY